MRITSYVMPNMLCIAKILEFHVKVNLKTNMLLHNKKSLSQNVFFIYSINAKVLSSVQRDNTSQ
jgi:hypothetical protein